jgi:tripartite-type tricarboxylate transporter receptor subunit TctC
MIEGTMKNNLLKSALLAVGLMLGSAQALAYPDKPVRIIVPWPAGGGADYIGRTFGKELSDIWKQPVVVDNVGGAGSIVGAERAARAAPDGYTFMVTINGTITSNRFLYKTMPYDPDRSFMPISLLVQSGQLILVNNSLKANTLKEFVEYVRNKPGGVSYASYGSGTQPHLLFELLKKRENIDMLHVPYKGLAPALTGVMSNEVQLTIVSPSSAAAALGSGRTKAIAIGSNTRAHVMPKIPTVAESGFPYLNATIWFGMFAPAGTPQAVIDKVQKDIATVVKRPEFAKALEERGFDIVASTPAQFTKVIQEEVARTAEMAEAANVKPE